MPKKPAGEKQIESFVHDDASRRNIPPAEYQTMVRNQEKTPLQVAYERRNPDLDPQLIWRGKDLLDDSPLVVNAPPLYIQEKIHPKVLIDDLKRRSKQGGGDAEQIDLFAAFNGLPTEEAKTEFYQHDQNWSNRMILGDSLQVMASLAEREGLRGKVQCIYFDPPYGIKFNSNFQWSTTSRDVRDGKTDHITREPEQVKAFRDTWKDGIHSYLSYLRDRLQIARELLADSGSIFVQIGDENSHRIRALLDEVFGDGNFVCEITFATTASTNSPMAKTLSLSRVTDSVVWFAKARDSLKYRQLYRDRSSISSFSTSFGWASFSDGSQRKLTKEEAMSISSVPGEPRVFSLSDLTGQNDNQTYDLDINSTTFKAGKRGWRTTRLGMERLLFASRISTAGRQPRYINFADDFSVTPLSNNWVDTGAAGFSDWKTYVVQTNTKVIERCIQMTSDPGDLVLDPTCGSGSTATVAEQWGRRWITIDTSRVALALARARIMGARHPYYLLADSSEGKQKEAELTRSIPSTDPVSRNIRLGFVCDRVPHITLKSIANNTEIDIIWEIWQSSLGGCCTNNQRATAVTALPWLRSAAIPASAL